MMSPAVLPSPAGREIGPGATVSSLFFMWPTRSCRSVSFSSGSLASGLLGYAVLRWSKPIQSSDRDSDEAAEIFGEDADEDPTVCNDAYSR